MKSNSVARNSAQFRKYLIASCSQLLRYCAHKMAQVEATIARNSAQFRVTEFQLETLVKT